MKYLADHKGYAPRFLYRCPYCPATLIFVNTDMLTLHVRDSHRDRRQHYEAIGREWSEDQRRASA